MTRAAEAFFGFSERFLQCKPSALHGTRLKMEIARSLQAQRPFAVSGLGLWGFGVLELLLLGHRQEDRFLYVLEVKQRFMPCRLI